MPDIVMTPQTKEIISRLYSSNEYNKREAIYRILFDRRADLIPELKKAVKYEKNEQIAVFMVQVCITISSFPRDSATEKRILELLQYDKEGGVNSLSTSMWKYLENCATSQMIIAILGAMGNSIPANGFNFIEMCLTHPDPDVRAMVCEKAIKSGRPTHFAYVLNLITDKDPIVAETAFATVKNLPENELAIILDYALGSPDEWVLNTVAPFLPNIVTQSLRGIILKVQYHPNHNIAIKAREALKILDAIPYSSKHTSKIQQEKQKKEEELKKQEQQKEEELKISLKEQMEEKRRAKEEEERRKREEEEALEKELSAMGSEEMAEFEREMANYDSVLPNSNEVSLNMDDNILPEQEEFLKDSDFSEEADNLNLVDDKNINLDLESDVVKPAQTPVVAPTQAPVDISTQTSVDTSSQTPITNTLTPSRIPNNEAEKPIIEEKKEISETNIADTTAETIDLAAMAENINISNNEKQDIESLESYNSTSNSSSEQSNTLKDIADDLDLSSFDLTAAASAETLDFSDIENSITTEEKEPDIDFTDGLSEFLEEDDINLIVTNENTNQNQEEQGISNNTIQSDTSEDELTKIISDFNKSESIDSTQKTNITNQDSVKTELQTLSAKLQTDSAKPQTESVKPQTPKQPTPDNTSVTVPASAKEIFAKYPSFITDPLLEVFKTQNDSEKIKAIEKVLDNLTAFLNLCFLQSAMYYAQESDMLSKSIKDCIKGNLIGPSALRCLHNFILAMKTVRGNPVFFTFPLSKVMSDSSDTNPLMLMRELKDFLREPEEPLDENIPQAIDGLLEILRGIRSITSNTIIMRAPAGAKQPYADLSGPSADVLSPDKRPSIDLPTGEVVLISKDGTEAFGLFPFFKYSKKKIIFTIPNHEELKTFYERLEITP